MTNDNADNKNTKYNNENKIINDLHLSTAESTIKTNSDDALMSLETTMTNAIAEQMSKSAGDPMFLLRNFQSLKDVFVWTILGQRMEFKATLSKKLDVFRKKFRFCLIKVQVLNSKIMFENKVIF